MMRTKDDAWTLTWETSQQSCICVTPPPAHHTEQAEWQCAQSKRRQRWSSLADFNQMGKEVRIHWRAAFCLTKRRDTGTKKILICNPGCVELSVLPNFLRRVKPDLILKSRPERNRGNQLSQISRAAILKHLKFQPHQAASVKIYKDFQILSLEILAQYM